MILMTWIQILTYLNLAILLPDGACFTWIQEPEKPTQAYLGSRTVLRWSFESVGDTFLFLLISKNNSLYSEPKQREIVTKLANGTIYIYDEFKDRAELLNQTTLVLTGIRNDDDGNYCCQAFFLQGMYTSCVDLLVLGHKPMNTSFISCSADNTVWVNDGIVFSCSSISSPSPAAYVIYHNGKKIKKNRSGYHKICNVKRQHAGNYTCQPRNTFGNGESKSIRLTVYEKLAVHAVPRWRNVTEGRAARFECSAAGSPPPNITWTSLSTGKVYSGGLLLIKSVQRNDTGDYQCSASNGLSAPTKDIVFLNVLYPPTITDTAGPNVNVKEGYKLTLYCHGNGNPQPVFTWKLLGTNQTFSGGDERNIMLNAQKSHAGVYLCTASNFLGNVSKTITVNVWSSPVRPILTHLECGSSFIRVSWKVLSQEEGSFVISYVAQAIDQDNPRNVFNCSDITINHCIIKGLQPNTTYLVRVYSTNVAGHGVSEYERITTKGEGTKKQQGTDNKTNEGLSTTTLMTVLAAVGIAIFVVLIGTLIAVRRTRSVGKGTVSNN